MLNLLSNSIFAGFSKCYLLLPDASECPQRSPIWVLRWHREPRIMLGWENVMLFLQAANQRAPGTAITTGSERPPVATHNQWGATLLAMPEWTQLGHIGELRCYFPFGNATKCATSRVLVV